MIPFTKSSAGFALIAVIAMALAPGSMANEFVRNGDFESTFYGDGVPSFWKANAGDGNSNLRDTTHLSPFNNIYSSGSQSVVLMDGPSNSNLPYLLQSFFPTPAQFAFSFEFSVDSVSDAPWKLEIGSSDSTLNVAFLINASSQLQLAGGATSTILTLAPATWYQMNAVVDDITGTISGTATPSGAAPVSFSGALLAGGPLRTEFLEVLDASSDQNPTLYLDNISIRTVPEPSFTTIFVLGLFLLVPLRRHKSRMPTL